MSKNLIFVISSVELVVLFDLEDSVFVVSDFAVSDFVVSDFVVSDFEVSVLEVPKVDSAVVVPVFVFSIFVINSVYKNISKSPKKSIKNLHAYKLICVNDSVKLLIVVTLVVLFLSKNVVVWTGVVT